MAVRFSLPRRSRSGPFGNREQHGVHGGMDRSSARTVLDEWSRDLQVIELLCRIEGLMPDTEAIGRLQRGRHDTTDLAKAFAVWAFRQAGDDEPLLP